MIIQKNIALVSTPIIHVIKISLFKNWAFHINEVGLRKMTICSNLKMDSPDLSTEINPTKSHEVGLRGIYFDEYFETLTTTPIMVMKTARLVPP